MNDHGAYKKIITAVLLFSYISLLGTVQDWQVTKVLDICRAVGVHAQPAKLQIPAPVLPAQPTVTMSAGQQLSLFSFVPNFNISPATLKANYPGSANFTELLVNPTNLNLSNKALINGVSVLLQLYMAPNSSGGYQAVVTGYNAATLTQIFQQVIPVVYLSSAADDSKLTTNAAPYAANLYGAYVGYARTAGTNGVPAADAATGVSVNLNTQALTQNILIKAAGAKSDSVYGGSIQQAAITVAKPVLPAQSAITMGAGQTLKYFAYSPNYASGYSELYIGTGSQVINGQVQSTNNALQLINASLSQGISVVLQYMFVADSAKNYQAVMTAYNAANLSTIICQEIYSPVKFWNGTAATTAVPSTTPFTQTLFGYQRNQGATVVDAQEVVGNTGQKALIQNLLITATTPVAASVLLPLSTALAPLPSPQTAIVVPAGETMLQFWFSPTFGIDGFGELPVGSSDLAKMNAVFAAGHALNIVYDIVNNGSGFVLSYAMYDATTQALICSNNFPPIEYNNALIPASATWGYSNFTYQTSSMKNTGMLTGLTASHPQALQIKSGANNVAAYSTIQNLTAMIAAAGKQVSTITSVSNNNPANFVYFNIAGNGLAIGYQPWANTPFVSMSVIPAGVNWNTGVQLVLLAYDASGNLITDLTTLGAQGKPASIYLYTYDKATGALIGQPASIPMNNFVVPSTNSVGAWNSNSFAGNPNVGAPGISGTYPAILDIAAASLPVYKTITATNLFNSIQIYPEIHSPDVVSGVAAPGINNAQTVPLTFSDLTAIQNVLSKGLPVNFNMSCSMSGTGYDINATATDSSGNVLATAMVQQVQAAYWNTSVLMPVYNETYTGPLSAQNVQTGIRTDISKFTTYHIACWGSSNLGLNSIPVGQAVQVVYKPTT